MSLREKIAAIESRHEDVPIDEWGMIIRISEMSAREAIAIGAQAKDPEKFAAALLAYSIVDETGARPYDLTTIGELMAKGHGSVTKLLDAARRVNGLDEAVVKNG